MNFEKIITNEFFWVALIELIIIMALIAYIIIKRWTDVDDDKSAVNKPYFAGRGTDQFYYWKEAYEKVYKELSDLKKGMNKEVINKSGQENKSEQSSYHLRDNSNIYKEHTYSSYNSHEEYAKREMEKRIYVHESKNEDGTVKSEISFDLKEEEPTSEPIPKKFEYLEGANGGQFRKLLPSDEKSFFRTWEENGIRKFEFHGSVEKALANINAIFDEVCEIEGKQNGATQIENVEPGILSSQLKVEKKAKIKLM